MTKPNRLRWASKRDMRYYRALAIETRNWKRDALAGNYRPLRSPRDVLGIGWDRMAFTEYRIAENFEYRALRQLRKSKQWPEIWDARDTQHLWEYDRPAYETKMLRRELDEHKKECHD